MSQIHSTTCADCFHSKESHHDGVCMGDLTCQCTKFVEPFLFEFAQRVEQEKHLRKGVRKRCEYILEKLPTTRNCSEKSFTKIYWEVWHGFKIRKKTPSVLDIDVWKRLPNGDLINREKRRVKKAKPELGTYDKEVLWHQTAIYQALLEMSSEDQ